MLLKNKQLNFNTNMQINHIKYVIKNSNDLL